MTVNARAGHATAESEGWVYRPGALLFVHRYPVAAARGTAVIVHGLNEHGGRYAHVARMMAAAGIDTLAFDHRGFGRSSGMRGDIPRFAHRLDDVEWAVRSQRQRHPGVPLVLVGHSMGGLIAARYVQSGRPRPDLLVLSGAAIDPRMAEGRRQRLKVQAGRAIARALPHLRLAFGPPGALSSDPAIEAAALADPLRVRGMGARLGLQLLEEMRAAWGGLGDVTLPVLLLHGADDLLVPPAATRDGATRFGSPDVTVRVYAGMRHEVVNERDRHLVLADLMTWLDARLPDRSVTGTAPAPARTPRPRRTTGPRQPAAPRAPRLR